MPSEAKSIEIKDNDFVEPPEFMPKRTPGLHLPKDSNTSSIDLFELFFDSHAVDLIVKSTFSYAEQNKCLTNSVAH